jgi:hypothetical protein
MQIKQNRHSASLNCAAKDKHDPRRGVNWDDGLQKHILALVSQLPQPASSLPANLAHLARRPCRMLGQKSLQFQSGSLRISVARDFASCGHCSYAR